MNHSRFLALALCPAIVCGAANANTEHEKRIESLEQKIAMLENSQKQTDWTDNIRISGFGSIIALKEDEPAGYINLGDPSDDWDFESNSKVGIQLNGSFTDSTSFTVQLLSKGIADWDVEVEWAYISHTFDNDIELRAGKLRLPVYMYADYLDVGYAQPFLRAPHDVYFPLSITSYMGMDFNYALELGDGQLSFQPYIGAKATTQEESSLTGSTIDLKNLYGLVLKYEWESLMVRGAYSEAEGDTDDPALVPFFDGVDGSFIEFGFRYDFDQLSVLGEFTEYEIKSAYPTIESWFVGLIYTMDEFAPYLVVSSAETTDDELRALPGGLVSGFDGERMSYSLGLRWDFAPRIAFKADVTYSDDFGDTSGFLPGNQRPLSIPGVGPTPIVDANFSDVTVISAGFDFIF